MSVFAGQPSTSCRSRIFNMPDKHLQFSLAGPFAGCLQVKLCKENSVCLLAFRGASHASEQKNLMNDPFYFMQHMSLMYSPSLYMHMLHMILFFLL